MKNGRFRLATRAICCMAFLLIMGNAAFAMQGPPPPVEKGPRGADREREIREKRLRSAEMEAAVEKRNEKRIKAAIKQVKKDFERIQIVRNEMVHNLPADKPLDYKFISEKSGEINERAARLKTFLMPPVPGNEEGDKRNDRKTDFNRDEMKGALINLCNMIAGFIDNPVLKNPGIVDVEQSAKAGGDLMKIIELSDDIKRSAERLGRESK